MDDILDSLDIAGAPAPQAENRGSYPKRDNNYNKKDKINMYDVEIIKPKEIDGSTFNKSGHSYIINVFAGNDDITEVKNSFLKIATKLNEKGYVFRMDGGEHDVITNDIMKLPNIKAETYLPFKKFNEPISEKAILTNSHEIPYRYAAELYGGETFNKLKKGARAVYASKIMAALGLTSDNPVDFILCYSPDGREHLPDFKNRDREKVDYTKLGSVSFYLKIAKAISVPVYNFKSKESLVSFVNTYLKPTETTPPPQPTYDVKESNDLELDLGV